MPPPKQDKPSRAAKAVRLDLSEQDYERLDEKARKLGLSKSSYARMIILKHLMGELQD